MAKVIKNKPQEFRNDVPYSWAAEDTFEISGSDFEFLHNFFFQEATTVKGTSPLDKVRGYNIFQELLKRAVQQGVAIPLEVEKIEQTVS